MKNSQNTDIGFLLKKIDEKLEKHLNANLNSLGITFVQLRVLIFVNESENQQRTQKEIENFLEVSHPTTNGIIKRLEEKDFLKTEMTLKNGRMSKNVGITKKGKEICKENAADKNLMERKFSDWLTKDEKAQLINLLEKIYEKLAEDKIKTNNENQKL